jgi:hypothetical protein
MNIVMRTFIYLESLTGNELIVDLALPQLQSGEWRIFEISAQTGSYHMFNDKQ